MEGSASHYRPVPAQLGTLILEIRAISAALCNDSISTSSVDPTSHQYNLQAISRISICPSAGQRRGKSRGIDTGCLRYTFLSCGLAISSSFFLHQVVLGYTAQEIFLNEQHYKLSDGTSVGQENFSENGYDVFGVLHDLIRGSMTSPCRLSPPALLEVGRDFCSQYMMIWEEAAVIRAYD